MKLKPLKQAGIVVFLSVQLLAVPAPTRAATLGIIDTGGLLGDLLGFAFPFLQGLSTDLLDGLSIGGIDLSSVIMDVVFSSDGLLNGGGLNVGGLLGTAGDALDPVLDQIPAGQEIYSILSGVLDGSISLQSLLKGGILESILATILGGSSDGSNPSTGETGGNSPGGTIADTPATATIGSGRI